jgi:hypothetical protein
MSWKKTSVIAGTAILVALSSTAFTSTADAKKKHWWGHHWRPWFGHNVNRLPTFIQTAPDETAQDSEAPGNLWVGSGIPATNMILRENPFAGVELSIKAHLRGGADILPTLVDSEGSIHVEVPSGIQPGTEGNPRAKWNFTYSYNVAIDPSNPTLDNYDAWLLVDSDPSYKTDYTKLRLARLAPTPVPGPGDVSPDTNGFGWKIGGTVAIPDDEGTEYVTQNSQNFAFGYSPDYAADGFPEGQFDVIMRISRKHGPLLNELHVVFDVVDP